MAMSASAMYPYFARLLRPAAVAPATMLQTLLPGQAAHLTLPESAAEDDVQEVELFLEAVQPVTVQNETWSRASQPAVAEPGDEAADGERVERAESSRQSGVNTVNPVPPVHGNSALVSEQSTAPKPVPTAARPTARASDHMAEAEGLQVDSMVDSKVDSTHSTLPLLGEVLRWVATPAPAASADAPSASAMDDLRPLSPLTNPDDRPVQATLRQPVPTVQAFRHPPLSSDRFPSGTPGTGQMAGGELPTEQVVRIAIGEIRVRIEAARQSPHETPPETARISPPEMPSVAPSRLSSGADASHSFTASGSLRRRCIHL